MTTSLTGTYTATRISQTAQVKITINSSTRELSGNYQYVSDNKLLDPVGSTVMREVLDNGTTSGTITVTIA